MATGSIRFNIDNERMSATAHTGGEVRHLLCTPKEGDGFTQFLSLEWSDWSHPPGQPGYSRSMSVYLERGEVEALRDLLNERLAQMEEADAAEEGGGEK